MVLKALGALLGGKARLFLEYGLIAGVVILCGAILALWISKQQIQIDLADTKTSLTAMTGRVNTIESLNQAQEEMIKHMRELRELDAMALTGLVDDYRLLTQKDEVVRNRLYSLESSNANVRSYLDIPVPPELGCLLNDTCATGNPGGNQNREGGTP